MSRSEWTLLPLGDFAELDIRRVSVEATSTYEIAGVLNAGQGLFAREAIVGSQTNYLSLHRLEAKQLVYRKLTAWEGPITVVTPEFEGMFVSSEFPTFKVDEEVVRADFMRLVCQRPAFWQEMRRRSAGTPERRNRLKPDELLQVEVELPPLSEQQLIVGAFQTVDAALAAAKLLMARAESFLNALRETRLVANDDWRSDGGWETLTLSDVSDVRLGFTKGRKLAGATRMLPYVRAVNVQDGFIALDDVAEIEASDTDLTRWALQADDILLLEGCGSPRLVGRGWIWDGSIEPCLHQNSTLRARVYDRDRIEPRFLAHALCASPARWHCYESMEQLSVAHLGLAGASSIPVPVPPISDQHAITRELDEARSVFVSAVRKAQRYGRARLSLLDSLLSGERRLEEGKTTGESAAV
jgi:type I restriction enzyme, S subunit